MHLVIQNKENWIQKSKQCYAICRRETHVDYDQVNRQWSYSKTKERKTYHHKQNEIEKEVGENKKKKQPQNSSNSIWGKVDRKWDPRQE